MVEHRAEEDDEPPVEGVLADGRRPVEILPRRDDELDLIGRLEQLEVLPEVVRAGRRSMTEAEWFACSDPERILRELGPAASGRKLRLFMCACCRRVWDLIQEPYCRVAVEVTEKHLEGEATDNEFALAADDVSWAWSRQESNGCVLAEEAAMYPTVSDPFRGAISCVHCIRDCCRDSSSDEHRPLKDAEAAVQASLLRCIFAHPFRAAAFIDEWRTAAVIGLSRQMYESRDFSLLPILGDALQDAGCEDEQLIRHCRISELHGRGCWPIDLVLARE